MNPEITVKNDDLVVSIEEFKAHARIVAEDEDSYIDGLLRASTEKAEQYTGRSFLTKTFKLYLDNFPAVKRHPDGRIDDRFEIRKGPVQSIESINYVNDDGSTVELAESEYLTALKSVPARVVSAYQKAWPSTRAIPEAVIVEFKAGYGEMDDVPNQIKQALKLIAQTWYDHRGEAMPEKLEDMPDPLGFRGLLGPFRVQGF